MTKDPEDFWKIYEKIRLDGGYSNTVHCLRPVDPLDFQSEARAYEQRVISQRSFKLRQAIFELSEQIEIPAGTRILRVIPVHWREKLNVRQIADCILDLAEVQCHTILFLNGTPEQRPPNANEAVEKAIQSLLPLSGREQISIVRHEFENRQPIGTIRGMIVDAVIKSALRSGMADPILLSNDIDHLSWAPDYGPIILKHFQDPCLDVLSGPTHHGYSPDGINYAPLDLAAPELLFGNRVSAARHAMMLEGRMSDGRLFITGGAHSAFRASAICAAGGYDYDRETAEDVTMGMAIFGIRSHPNAPYPSAINAIYDYDFWLATDPRRPFSAVAQNICMRHAWMHVAFGEEAGHQLRLDEIKRIYTSNRQLMQVSDISVRGEFKLSDRGRRRVLSYFARSLDNVEFDQGDLQRYAIFFGLNGITDRQDLVDGVWSIRPELQQALINVARGEHAKALL